MEDAVFYSDEGHSGLLVAEREARASLIAGTLRLNHSYRAIFWNVEAASGLVQSD